MPATLTCPRCASPAPSSETRCATCGHDLRTPVLESLDPPSVPRDWRTSLDRIPPAVPVLASIGALLLAGAALVVALQRPDLAACGRLLWDQPIGAEELPEGWRLRTREPHELGWTAQVEQETGRESFQGGAIVTVSCSSDPVGQLAVVRAWSEDGNEVEFRSFGDETVAIRDAALGGYQVWWRRDRVVGRVSWYGGDVETALLETLTEAVVDSTR